MKYKVGDKVKIREDLDTDKIYGDWDCSEDMAQCGGKIATIVRCCDDSYKIDLEDNFYNWTDEMFEDVPKSKFNIGDKVRVRRDLEVGNKYNGLTLTDGMYACHSIMTIESLDDDNYTCTNSHYFWGEDMLEKVEETEDNEQVRTVDVGFHLDYCGHRVIENVYYGGYTHDHNHVFCTTTDSKNQYTLPIDAIDFIIPHEVD